MKTIVGFLIVVLSSATTFGQNSLIQFHNARLDSALTVFGKYYHFRVCNPLRIAGTPITDTYSLDDSAETNILYINCLEKGFASLVYEPGGYGNWDTVYIIPPLACCTKHLKGWLNKSARIKKPI